MNTQKFQPFSSILPIVVLVLLLGVQDAYTFPPHHRYVPGEVLISVDPALAGGMQKPLSGGRLPPSVLARCREEGLLSVKPLGGSDQAAKPDPRGRPPTVENLYLLRFPPDTDVERIARELAGPGVRYAEPNFVGSLAVAPSDEFYVSNQQALYRDVLGLEDA